MVNGLSVFDHFPGLALKGLKSDVDDLDIDKLKTVPDDLSKLSNIVKNDVTKRLYMMNRLKKL